MENQFLRLALAVRIITFYEKSSTTMTLKLGRIMWPPVFENLGPLACLIDVSSSVHPQVVNFQFCCWKGICDMYYFTLFLTIFMHPENAFSFLKKKFLFTLKVNMSISFPLKFLHFRGFMYFSICLSCCEWGTKSFSVLK